MQTIIGPILQVAFPIGLSLHTTLSPEWFYTFPTISKPEKLFQQALIPEQ